MAHFTQNISHKALQDARALVALLEGDPFTNMQTPIQPGLQFSFPNHDERLRELIEAANSLRESFSGHVIKSRRWRNAQLPIHRHLPPELFVRIIDYTYDYNENLWNVNTFSSVCYFWRCVVDGAPSLWTSINSWASQPLVQKALIKSAQAPFDIRVYHDDTYYDFHTDLEPHLARCRSQNLFLNETRQIFHFVPVPAPLLERLDIEVEEHADQDPALNVSTSVMPRLRHLNVSGVIVRMGSQSALKSLQMAYLPDGGRSLKDLCKILRSNSQLESLNLSSDFSSAKSPSPNVPTILLPHLKTLSIDSGDDSAYADLPFWIEAPQLRSFNSPLAIVSTSSLKAMLRQITQVISPAAGREGKVMFSFLDAGRCWFDATRRSNLQEIPLNHQAYEVKIVLPTTFDTQLLELIRGTLLRHLPNVEVYLDFKNRQDTQDRFKSWLTLSRHITRLRISASPVHSAVFQHLSSRQPNGWPCPKLKRVRIDAMPDPWATREIVEWATSRYGERPADGVEPLEMLSIWVAVGADTAPWLELENILGKDRVRVVFPDDANYQLEMNEYLQ